MEKIITVKQEPVDENYACNATTSLASGAVQIVASLPAPVTSSSQPIILVPAKNETAVTAAQCSFATSTQAPSCVTPKKGATSQGSPQLVVISAGSPIKITPIAIKTSGSRGSVQAGPSANVTFVQVQPIAATGKQSIVPRAAGSPSKQPVQVQKVVPITVASSQIKTQPTGNVQFTVATSAVPTTTTVRQIAPKVLAPLQTGNQVIQAATAMQVQQQKPLQVQQQLAPKPVQLHGPAAAGQHPRLIVPAIAPNMNATSTGLQFPHGLISGGVVYLPQQALSSGGAFPIAVPLSANAFTPNTGEPQVSVNGNSQEVSPPNRPRKPCNCTKSQCLKLYCDCFANGEFCSNCNCVACFNNMEHEKERSKAIKACLERNPQAFHPKIGKGKVGESERRHNKGCHCKRSGCLKNYCECYEAKILCTSLCKCTGCKNFEESPERKTLMHLADAAEVRVKQQHAAKTKLESQIEDLPSRSHLSSTGERLPFSFVTEDVVNATCQCLFAQAIEAEKSNKPIEMAERIVLEEFGRCLLQIIHTANKTKGES